MLVHPNIRPVSRVLAHFVYYVSHYLRWQTGLFSRNLNLVHHFVHYFCFNCRAQCHLCTIRARNGLGGGYLAFELIDGPQSSSAALNLTFCSGAAATLGSHMFAKADSRIDSPCCWRTFSGCCTMKRSNTWSPAWTHLQMREKTSWWKFLHCVRRRN